MRSSVRALFCSVWIYSVKVIKFWSFYDLKKLEDYFTIILVVATVQGTLVSLKFVQEN